MIFLRAPRAIWRTVTALVGVALAFALQVAVGTLVQGLRGEAAALTAGYDADVIVQARGASTPTASRITPAELAALAAHVGQVLPVVVGTSREEWSAFAVVVGVPAAAAERFGLAIGRSPHGPDEAVVGAHLAERQHLALGGRVALGGRAREVVGIYRVGNHFLDDAVVLDLESAQDTLRLGADVSLALVGASGPAAARDRAAAIEGAFPRLSAKASQDFVGALRGVRALEAFVHAVELVTLGASLLVVTSTLLMTLTERTRDVGVLMAIGWSGARIVRALFVETLALCLVGAGIGAVLSAGVLTGLSQSSVLGFGWIPHAPAPWAIARGLAWATALATAAMLWPTWVVARTTPAAALRWE